jgi:transcription elongation factor Elf1
MGNLFTCPWCGKECVTFDSAADGYQCRWCGWRCGVPDHGRRFMGIPIDVSQEQIDREGEHETGKGTDGAPRIRPHEPG